MTPKEKSLDLVEKFKDYVHGYVGSSMLTNHEYPDQIFNQAKKVALIVAEECLNCSQYKSMLQFEAPPSETVEYWLEVKAELQSLTYTEQP